jgi:hypothetical protein
MTLADADGIGQFLVSGKQCCRNPKLFATSWIEDC